MARNAAQISVYDGVSRQGFSTPAREYLKKMTPLGKSTLRACLKSHVLAASRLVINWIMAIRIHVSVVSGKASKSLLNRRERLSQPKVRSTIQRHCSTRNP